MPFASTVIDGGLDLITAPQAVKPGRLLACSNYEIARTRGLRRMDGFEKYDGGQSPSTGNSILAAITIQTSIPPFGMAVGDACHLTAFTSSTGITYTDQNGTIFFVDNTGLYPVVYVSLFSPLPYVLSSMVGQTGFAFFDDTTTNSYNILSAGPGAPSVSLFPPGSLQAQAVASSFTDPFTSLLVPGTTYGYRASVLNTNGESQVGPETTVTTSATVEDTSTGALYIPSTSLALVGVTSVNFVVGQTLYCSDGTNTIIGRLSFAGGLGIDIAATADSGFTIVSGDPASMGAGVTVVISQVIKILWTPTVPVTDVPDPTTYNLYGRTPSAELKIANVNIGDGNTIPYYTDYGTVVPAGAMPSGNTTGTVGSTLDNLGGNFTAISASIQQVPGQGNVNGIFWLKDRVYATRDYFTMSYSAGSVQPNIGDVCYQGASFAAATWSGTLVKLTVTSGSFGSSNDAAGLMMFYNISGTHSNAAAVFDHTQGDVQIATFGLQRTASAAGLYVAMGDRGATVTTQSWQWCDLGWTIHYKSGQANFVDMNVALQELNQTTDQHVTTGWKVAASVASGGAWNTGAGFLVSDISAPSDGQYAEWTFYTGTPKIPSQTVTISNFGFTNTDIPANSAITGVELEMIVGGIGYNTHYTAKLFEKTIQFVGATGPNLASSTPIPITGIAGSGTIPRNSYANYIWTTKFWGAPLAPSTTPVQTLGYGLTPDLVTDTGFGLSICYTLDVTGVQQVQVGIDYVALRFSYLPQTNFVYFWNVGATSPSAVKAQIVMHYKQGGDLTLQSESGTLYFQFVQSDGSAGGLPSRPIGSDEQIRTYPGGGTSPDGGVVDGSTLLALTANMAEMNVMDWSELLKGAPQPDGTTAPASKYVSVTKNFYASSGLDAIYGVSGGGPAFYYDGPKTNASGVVSAGNFSRILTGLPLQFETPREICYHQSKIVLTYFFGVIEWSNSANTLSFDPNLFDKSAGNAGFGERVVAARSVNGDVLAIWTQSTVQMLQGNLNTTNLPNSNLYPSTISPTSGGIEYTIQPMANYTYCDFRGITAIGATQKYGDFELGHYSSDVQPWIIPRVQLSSFFEGPNIGIINSVLFRNKNMVRYFFADAAALSITFIADNENPQFSIQNYYNTNNVPLTWDVVQAFTETLGRDRIFGATADGTGFVYELDRSNTFNDEPITGFATLVPDTQQLAYQNKEFRGINIYGQAQDYAQFTLSRSVNYIPTQQQIGSNVITETFGSLMASPVGTIVPFVSYGTANISIEGTAISLRFDFSSRLQFSHTIQAVAYTVDPLQEKEG